jgi:hypothetical protein
MSSAAYEVEKNRTRLMNRKNLRREVISKYKDESLCNVREGLKIRSVHASSILIE